MTGTVRAREAHIRIKVRGPNGQREHVEAVIDTGFTGWLTLPPSLISSLGLRWTNKARGLLADGRESLFDVFEASLLEPQTSIRPGGRSRNDWLGSLYLMAAS